MNRPEVDETVWVPMWIPPAWRDDDKDRKPNEQEKAS